MSRNAFTRQTEGTKGSMAMGFRRLWIAIWKSSYGIDSLDTQISTLILTFIDSSIATVHEFQRAHLLKAYFTDRKNETPSAK